MPKTPPYSKEFKREAVALLRTSGRPVPQLAKEPLVDLSILAEIFDADDQGRADLVALFLSRSHATIAELAAALEASEAEAAGRLAHGLKGSAAVVGATRLAAVASRLCELSQQGASMMRSRCRPILSRRSS